MMNSSKKSLINMMCSAWLIQFVPNWKLTVFVVFFFPLTLSLGYWQLSREQEKIQLQTQFTQAQLQEPQILRSELTLYQKVRFSGELLKPQALFLDNRTFQGRAGFELIMPIALTNSNYDLALVNLGWIAGNSHRDQLPTLPVLPTQVNWQGLLRQPLEPENQEPLNSQLVQQVSYQHLPIKGQWFPYLIELDSQNPYALHSIWQPNQLPPERHRAYAIQWFALAGTLMVLYLVAGFRNRSEAE